MDLGRISIEIEEIARSLGWTVKEKRVANTGSIYIDLNREDEWCVIRVADHKQVYFKWLTTYSLAPGNLYFEEVEAILAKPYGEVGDIIEPY